MGGAASSAKSKSDVIYDSVTKVITEHIMKCRANKTLSQDISIHGSGNTISGVTQKMGLQLSTQCVHDSSQMSAVQNEIANKIMQTANSQSVSLLGVLGKTQSDVETKIRNSVNNTITSSTLTEVINDTNVKQSLIIKGDNNVAQNVTMEMTAQILSDNVSKLVNNVEVLHEIKNTTEAQSASKQSNFIADVVDSAGGVVKTIGDSVFMMLIVGLIALIIAMKLGLLNGFLPPQFQQHSMPQQQYMPQPQYMPQQQYMPPQQQYMPQQQSNLNSFTQT